MAKKWNPKVNITFTYKTVTGKYEMIHVGEDGVTQDWINFLEAEEHIVELQERYQMENTDYGFLNATRSHGKHPDSGYGDPLEQIPDPAADILQIICSGDAEIASEYSILKKAIEKLTSQQQDLIYELFYEQKTIAQIAREQSVTHGAIQDRRRKILTRLKNILSEIKS